MKLRSLGAEKACCQNGCGQGRDIGGDQPAGQGQPEPLPALVFQDPGPPPVGEVVDAADFDMVEPVFKEVVSDDAACGQNQRHQGRQHQTRHGVIDSGAAGCAQPHRCCYQRNIQGPGSELSEQAAFLRLSHRGASLRCFSISYHICGKRQYPECMEKRSRPGGRLLGEDGSIDLVSAVEEGDDLTADALAVGIENVGQAVALGDAVFISP